MSRSGTTAIRRALVGLAAAMLVAMGISIPATALASEPTNMVLVWNENAVNVIASAPAGSPGYGQAPPLAALSLVLCFFAGAFAASMIIESRFWGGQSSRAYAFALISETLLLLLFTLLSYVTTSAHPRVQDAETALLCAAMGLQNALVSRLSGAVVRTTHLTGVVTDLGIESARWFRFWRRSLSEVTHFPFVLGRNPAERPAAAKVLLLGTIAASFLAGASAGAYMSVHWGHVSMLVAASAVAACAAYALRDSRL